MPHRALTRVSLLDATRDLADRDPDLHRILQLHGPPPLWARRPGFGTLVRIILEQQVSLASARSAYDRLERSMGGVTPDRVRALGGPKLRELGLTRQKTRYLLELARALLDGHLDLKSLSRVNDEEARAALMTVTGIGAWTADIYLLMALRRKDVWPAADLALAKSLQSLKRLPAVPTSDDLETMAQGWRPLRSVAARMLWHYYLSGFDSVPSRPRVV